MKARSFFLALALIACSSPGSTPKGGLAPGSSHLELSYLLGHDLYRFSFQADQDLVVARKFLGHDQVLEAQVDRSKYLELLQRASDILGKARKPANDATCRAPFTLSVQDGQSRLHSTGCRQGDEGTGIGKLARDAEVLMYFKK